MDCARNLGSSVAMPHSRFCTPRSVREIWCKCDFVRGLVSDARLCVFVFHRMIARSVFARFEFQTAMQR